jgi:transposase
MTEGCKLRAGVIAARNPGEKIGRLTPEQAESARLRRQLAVTQRRLGITEVALGIMGNTHELLEEISNGSNDGDTPPNRR